MHQVAARLLELEDLANVNLALANEDLAVAQHGTNIKHEAAEVRRVELLGNEEVLQAGDAKVRVRFDALQHLQHLVFVVAHDRHANDVLDQRRASALGVLLGVL